MIKIQEEIDLKSLLAALNSFKKGEFTARLPEDLTGMSGKIADTFNDIMESHQNLVQEITNVSRTVGREGLLSNRATQLNGTGGWSIIIKSVNSLIDDLVRPTTEMSSLVGAVAKGNLTHTMSTEVDGRLLRGQFLRSAQTANTMVEQLSSFAAEVTRVAREVGTEGKLGGQAKVKNVEGTWKDLTDSVNSMAGNLTSQVRNIAEVTTAVASGDLSKKITVDVKGEILELKNTINVMVDQLRSFASEVTRVAREVGTEGKLGGQANVPEVAGTWKDLTDNVNSMASNLTGQVRNIAEVTTAVAKGDLSKKIKVDVKGEILELKDTINVMVDQLNSFASEVTRVAREVGTEGRLGGQANVSGASGTWKDLTDNVNFMASNLTGQVRNIAAVTTAVARGDLSKKITVDVKGEILELKDTINVMVDQLSSFASEVTRVAREVGTEGKLGGQAQVEGAAGTWKDLTDNVNFMAANLTAQVRGIAGVVSAVAEGDLKKKLTVATRGEIATLANTINEMTDTLAVFADQATTVAREVGVEGKLGGQANVPGAAGTWKDLTENVNQLAANLTNQVRAIAEVATAVTRGDLSRSIQVEARGEVSFLKDNINEMIRNLKETTQKNAQQDWLKTNLARFTRLLQGQRDLDTVTSLILSELAPLVFAHHGMFYMIKEGPVDDRLELLASYGFKAINKFSTSMLPGEGLVGQCAKEKQRILLKNIPDDYVMVSSGLGSASPANIIILPILFEQEVKAVIEIASLEEFTETHISFLDQLMESIGVVLNTIESTSRTESLLTQSQSLAQELQQTNQELAEKARLLSEQNFEVEQKNKEVEHAKLELEDKATQLALSSRYKSEFLANMSHELRTPLNSLLILAQQLSQNPDSNLSETEVEFAKTIHGSGTDLLTLINDILDLAKIESGTVTLELNEHKIDTLSRYVERTFKHMAEIKKINFSVNVLESTPNIIKTDITRLQQIVKNLLSNAFKFTSQGTVSLTIGLVKSGWTHDHPNLSKAKSVVAFSVADTGVGIAEDKLKLIFEAFQQADGSTARKYGGTGLGLSISRELARLLTGEIHVSSKIGEGSTFTLFLPLSAENISLNNNYQLGNDIDNQFLPNVNLNSSPLLEFVSPYSSNNAQAVKNEIIKNKFINKEILDNQEIILSEDSTVLVIESDAEIATQIREQVNKVNFKCIVTSSGDSALSLARDYLPVAIFLDVDNLTVDGYTILDLLKRDILTRNIPVHIISSIETREISLQKGAISFVEKPLTCASINQELIFIKQFLITEKRNLLIVEDDIVQQNALLELIGHDDINIFIAGSGSEALEILMKKDFDCVVLDLTLPDIDGFKLLEKIGEIPKLNLLPFVIHTAKDLSRKESNQLKKLAKSIVLKDARSPEKLLNETALFLHRSYLNLSKNQQRMIDKVYSDEHSLSGKQVLIVDDDIRNIFALSSVLEKQEMIVIHAENGRSGIELLKNNPQIQIVLMDIMMPEMDGYDTMKAIRKMNEFKSLPIITLTAKAMKGDRDKCIDAGASDYITKPVDIPQLLFMMRTWLYK